MLCVTPAAPLEEESIYIASKLRLFLNLRWSCKAVKQTKLEVQLINSNSFLSSIVLQASSHEGLREEEATHPKNLGSSAIDPLIKEFDTSDEILNPAAKRFQTQKTFICPKLAHLVIKYAVAEFL